MRQFPHFLLICLLWACSSGSQDNPGEDNSEKEFPQPTVGAKAQAYFNQITDPFGRKDRDPYRDELYKSLGYNQGGDSVVDLFQGDLLRFDSLFLTPYVAEKAMQLLPKKLRKELDKNSWTAADLAHYTEIVPEPYTKLITIKIKCPGSEGLAVAYLEKLMEAYEAVANDSLSKMQEAYMARWDELQEQIGKKLDSLNRDMGELSKERGSSSLDDDAFFQKIVKNKAEIRSLELKKKSLSSLRDALSSDPIDYFAIGPSIGSIDPSLNGITQKLVSLDKERRILMSEQSSNQPRIEALQDSIQSQTNRLKSTVVNLLDHVEDVLEKKKQEEKEVREKLFNRRAIIAASKLEREMNQWSDLYSQVLSKQAESEIARAGILPYRPLKIIEAPAAFPIE